ncbi:MAG: AMP-dependent synthetase, partial [Chloroflexi bacterium]|nr:AMP-dependent synthetase [Chloroflexota bacterium]
VAEAAALGVPDEVKGEAVVAFVILQPGYEPNEVLRRELNEQMVMNMGKPLAPKEIRFVGAIPKTRNAKVMRRVIRAVYLGQDPGDLSALVNPEALDEIRQAV